MPEVYKLGISIEHNQSINGVNSINVLANQGVVGDRHFKEFNDPYNQLSLIESENIDYYNLKYGLNIVNGDVVYQGVADAFNLKHVDIKEVL